MNIMTGDQFAADPDAAMGGGGGPGGASGAATPSRTSNGSSDRATPPPKRPESEPEAEPMSEEEQVRPVPPALGPNRNWVQVLILDIGLGIPNHKRSLREERSRCGGRIYSVSSGSFWVPNSSRSQSVRRSSCQEFFFRVLTAFFGQQPCSPSQVALTVLLRPHVVVASLRETQAPRCRLSQVKIFRYIERS